MFTPHGITKRITVILTVATGCSQDHTARDPDAAVLVPAEREGTRDHHLVRRDCDRSRLGPEWLAAGPGVTCTDDAQCTDKPRGHCIGLPEALCSYGGRLGHSDDLCEVDGDCTRGGATGRCETLIRTTFCMYDTCADDGDCATGSQCQCPDATQGTADRWCVQAGCDQDEDCADGQVCRTDYSIAGALPRHCSSDRDTCASDQDCGPLLFCGYDLREQSWSCRSLIMIVG